MAATATSRRQVTIPKPVRSLPGIKPGHTVEFQRAGDGRVVLIKVGGKQRPSRFARLRGHAGNGLGTSAIMALANSKLRGRSVLAQSSHC